MRDRNAVRVTMTGTGEVGYSEGRVSMLSRVDLRGDRTDPTDRLPRATADVTAKVQAVVGEIIVDVQRHGDEALTRLTAELDGYDGATGLEIPHTAVQEAVDSLDPAMRASLERAVDQVRWFHERARPPDWEDERDGVRMGVRHQPIRRLGVYVPGGLAPLLSSAIMTVVPAHVAGVEELVLFTPPNPDGSVNQSILAAAELAGGVDRIFCVGGAQAVAAAAYGTASVPRCDKIVGPGNAYVAEAKLQVFSAGACGIDLRAGTTEVAVIADDAADPRLVAADLIGQAEHDPMVASILITPSEGLAAAVDAALDGLIASTKHSDRIITALQGQGAAVLTDDLDHAVEVADAYAAEHLEIHTEDPDTVAAKVRFAGGIFIGPYTPVSVGDYGAGPNHTLPTGGAARFTGGLRTDDFLVPVNWVAYDRDTLTDFAGDVARLAYAEDMPAHAQAVTVRFDDAQGREAEK